MPFPSACLGNWTPDIVSGVIKKIPVIGHAERQGHLIMPQLRGGTPHRGCLPVVIAIPP